LTFDELLGIPALESDPPGHSSKRVERYADYLYGAVDASGIRATDVSEQ
jgi:hypothetical protein